MTGSAALRVLFVVPHPIEGPSSRFRVYQFLPYLESHGIRATVRPLIDSRLAPIVYRQGHLGAKVAITAMAACHRLLDVVRSGRFDVVYVLREAFPFGPPWIEFLLRKGAGRLIFDFDDAIYHRSLIYANPLDRLRDFDKPAAIIRRADHVVVGSAHLRDYALRFTVPERVTVLPTVVDTRVFAPRPERTRAETVTVGWVGTPRGSAYLQDLTGAFTELVRRCPQVRFTFIGAEPYDTAGLPITFRPWRLDTEVSDIGAFDIGLMPLTDDEETRGKCGFKLIEYMSLGIPTVSSPVGANRDIVEEGRSGLFAEAREGWIAAIAALVEQEPLRAMLAANGRRRVEEGYSLAVTAPRLASLIAAVAKRH